jgi:2-methylisocitrate lyase-like PEP mutase family enzyme
MDRSTQNEYAQTFQGLHRKGSPVVLFNAWDAGSSRVVAEAGAKAIATGSWSVAAAYGYEDGEALPLDIAIENLARIVAAVALPVTIDLEAGYGDAPEVVATTATRAIEAGAIGFNIEDRLIGREGLYTIEAQVARIRAARAAAERFGVPAFINARTDLFLNAPTEQHDAALVDAALARVAAYAGAGASGFFVPGLIDEKLIRRVCEASPLPVNIMMRPGAPDVARLAALGVARVSYGPGPYRQVMRALGDAARAVYSA